MQLRRRPLRAQVSITLRRGASGAAAAAGLFGLFAPAAPAQDRSGADLAADYGCYSCHGAPPRKDAPTFPQLAARCAPHRDDAKAQQRLSDRLREGKFFGHVDAHERLSPEAAARLVRWICDGAR